MTTAEKQGNISGMSELEANSTQPSGGRSGLSARLGALAAIVAFEALALWAGVAWLVRELAVDRPDSLSSAVALTVLATVIALWVTATAVGLARRARWSRGSTITWQVLQTAVAVGASQGATSNVGITLALFVPAAIAFWLAVSRSTRDAFGVDEPGR